jgi:glycosyltransferase involved in cell wall biosynthesis
VEDAPSRGATLADKKVVFVLAWSVLGGAERSALATAEYLADEEGAAVEVVGLTSEDGRARRMFRALGIPWHAQPTDWHGTRQTKARQLGALAWRLRRMRPDVLLPYTSRPNILSGLIWRTTGASLCVWNQQDVFRSGKFGRRLTAQAVRQTPVFIANSETAGRFLVSELGAPPDRVRVLLEGAEIPGVDGLRDDARARLGIDGRAPVVSMLAHLHPGKDHATLLRAWRSVLDVLGEAGPVLLLAGRPSGTEDSVKALAFDLDLRQSVRFLGDVADVESVLAASDVAVLSSPSESAPKAIIESMAAGLPIAATDIAAIRELVSESQLRFLTPVGDPEGLAGALRELLSSPGLREELGRENRQQALRRASVDFSAARVEVIERALATCR